MHFERNCGRNCQFYIVFFENCKIFFRTLSPLCTCLSIRASCIDWFRNHPPVKQIYRIIVKKNTSNKIALSKRQTTHFKLSLVIALNFAITVNHIAPRERVVIHKINFCRRRFQRIETTRKIHNKILFIIHN